MSGSANDQPEPLGLMNTKENLTQVAIVCQGIALRAGLHVLLAAEPGIQLTREAAFLAEIDRLPEDTTILIIAGDANLSPAYTDIARFTHIGILFLVKPGNPLPFASLKDAPPVWGILSEDCTPEELIAAIGALRHGLIAAHPTLINLLLAEQPPPAALVQPLVAASQSSLTPREIEVLQQLALGLTNKQIAFALNISEHTIKFHISSIYSKLQVMNRAEAVRKGIIQGLIAI